MTQDKVAPAPLHHGHTAPDRDGRVIRLIVYVMLVVNAGAAVFFGDRLWSASRDGSLPLWAPLLAPAAFTAFVVVYTVDRWLLVRRRRYPFSRALFQVALALVFLTLLLPRQASELQSLKHADAGPSQPALFLLAHPDEGVRAAACGLILGRFSGDVYERVQHAAQADASPQVRSACAHALERMHSAQD